jgi:peptide/nickel transport system substrate-binding protein
LVGPARLGRLVVGTETDVEGLDPARAAALATTRVYRTVHQGLVKYRPGTVDLVPDLAESWSVSPDGKTYTFNLRRDVRFHDGSAFDAEAVRFSYRRMIDRNFEFYDPKNVGGFFMVGLKDVEVTGPHQVRMHLERPNAAFLELSNIYAGVIVSPAQVRKVGNDGYAESPSGTGAFRFVQWEKGRRVVVERNHDYWGPAPGVEQIIFVPIPEASARVAALLAGEVDMIVVVPPDAIDKIKRDANLIYEQGPGMHYWWITLNTREGPFKDKRVRQAANYAVNKEALTRDILRGSAVPATQPLPPTHWAHNEAVAGYPYNPRRARELLAAAGLPEGFSTKLIYPVSGSGMMVPGTMVEFIQANLREVGITVSLESFEWVSYIGKWVRGLSGDVHMNNQSIMAHEPWVTNFVLHGKFMPPNGWNTGWYSNPRVDEMLDRGVEVIDRAARKRFYDEAWRLVVEDAPWIFVCHDLQPMGLHRKVQGYVNNPAYVIDFSTILVPA